MRKNIIISIIVSIIIFILGIAIVNKLSYKSIATVTMNNEYNIIAGVIRNSGNGWKLIQNETHETIGIKNVTQDDEKITITYDENKKVNALSTTVDETMANEGYKVGASVGVDKTWIYIYDKDNKPVNPNDYSNSKGNIWVEGIFRK